MKKSIAMLLFAVGLATGLALASPRALAVGPDLIRDPGLYRIKVLESIRDVKTSISLIQHSLQLAQADRDLLKVCHSIGMLNATMATFAAWALYGPLADDRRPVVNESVLLTSEINTFCRVAVNIKDVTPRERISDARLIPPRLRALEFTLERIEKGLER